MVNDPNSLSLGKSNDRYKENPLKSISTIFDSESVKDRQTLDSLFRLVIEDK